VQGRVVFSSQTSCLTYLLNPETPALWATSKTRRSSDPLPEDFESRGEISDPFCEIRKLNRASPPSRSADSESNFLQIPSIFAFTRARY